MEIERYLRLMKIRKAISLLLFILVVSWGFRTVFTMPIPFKEDPIRVILLIATGMMTSLLLGTFFYESLIGERDDY
jgi:hypothetical protein